MLSQGKRSIGHAGDRCASLELTYDNGEFFASPESEVGATAAQMFGSDSSRRTLERFGSVELVHAA